ncbi:MAG: hypothetical protein ACLVFI_03040 [Christensenellales bacterium]
MSNSSDAKNYLKTESGIKKLGIADAKGIAEYFGLKKKVNGKNSLTVLGNGKMQMEFTLKVHGNSLMKSGIILDPMGLC